MMKNYRMRKGLSLKPFFTFLVFFAKRLRNQLKNFDNMANGFKSDIIRFRREGVSGRNKARNLCYSGEQLYDGFKVGSSFYLTNLNLKSLIPFR